MNGKLVLRDIRGELDSPHANEWPITIEENNVNIPLSSLINALEVLRGTSIFKLEIRDAENKPLRTLGKH